jgi:hypothetical protein
MSSPYPSIIVNQNLSLYIPQVLSTTTAEEITTVFEKFDFGKVRCVDLVSRTKVDGDGFENSAYIYFDEWNTSGMVSRFQDEVYNGEASMFYEDPYLWKVYKNRDIQATNAAGARLMRAIQKPDTNELGARLMRAIQKPDTNELGARLLRAIGGGFALNHCNDRICVL